MKTLWRGASLAIVSLGVLVACSVTPGDPNGLRVDPPTEPMAMTHDVDYYPACGNEILSLDGDTWYPFRPADGVTMPEDPIGMADAAGLSPEASWTGGGAGVPGAVATIRIVPLVAAPGPGDNVGTLVEFAGGFAYWESQNGDLSTWLTSQRLEYTWVC